MLPQIKEAISNNPNLEQALRNCDVYWDSRKKQYSVRSRGKVVAKLAEFYMINVDFVVSEKGRQRVLRERVKNVHAVLRGSILRGKPKNVENRKTVHIKYNPYEDRSFKRSHPSCKEGMPVFDACAIKCSVVNKRPVIEAYLI